MIILVSIHMNRIPSNIEIGWCPLCSVPIESQPNADPSHWDMTIKLRDLQLISTPPIIPFHHENHWHLLPFPLPIPLPRFAQSEKSYQRAHIEEFSPHFYRANRKGKDAPPISKESKILPSSFFLFSQVSPVIVAAQTMEPKIHAPTKRRFNRNPMGAGLYLRTWRLLAG